MDFTFILIAQKGKSTLVECKLHLGQNQYNSCSLHTSTQTAC